jgi:transketolase
MTLAQDIPQSAHEARLSIDDLRDIADACRAFIRAVNRHVGSNLSVVECLVTLYFSGLRTIRSDPSEPTGDALILSKGHASTSLYFCLWLAGIVSSPSMQELTSYGSIGHPLPRLPRRTLVPGVEFGAGNLGQGLSFANGIAIADRIAGRSRRIFAVLGDGECGSGQIWEAAGTAVRLGLRSVTPIIDANGYGSHMQLDRSLLPPRWRGFGWDVLEVDGNNFQELLEAMSHPVGGDPVAIIMNTAKGNGLTPEMRYGNPSGSVAPNCWPESDNQDHKTSSLPTSASGAAERIVSEFSWDVSRYPVGTAASVKLLAHELCERGLLPNDVIFLSPDAVRNSGLAKLFDRHGSWTWENASSQLLECAIAEQDTASMAAGMAASGLRPVVFLMESFVWRMLDAIRESICFQDVPVVIVGTSGGLGDELGPMVQSDYCMGALLNMLNLELFEASDINEARVLLEEALLCGKPAYLRLPHEELPVARSYKDVRGLAREGGLWIAEGPAAGPVDVTLIGAGSLMHNLRAGARQLMQQGHRVRIVNVFSVSRASRAGRQRMTELTKLSRVCVSAYNGPPTVLGQFLPEGSIALGLRSWGISGAPVSALYEAAGLGVRDIVAAVEESLRRPADET